MEDKDKGGGSHKDSPHPIDDRGVKKMRRHSKRRPVKEEPAVNVSNQYDVLKEDEDEKEKRCDCSDEMRMTCEHPEYVCEYCPCEDVTADKLLVQCHGCCVWYHSDCVGLTGLTEVEIEMLVSWRCCVCWMLSSPLVSSGKVLVPSEDLSKEDCEEISLATLRDEIYEVKGMLKSSELKSAKSVAKSFDSKSCSTVQMIMKEELNKIIEVVRVTVKDELKKEDTFKSFADVVKKEVKGKATLDKQMVEEVVKTNFCPEIVEKTGMSWSQEQYEQERRKRNIVIKDVPESDSNDNEQRKTHDLKFLTDELELKEKDIRKFYRVGQRAKGKTRPMICVLASVDDVMSWTNNGRGMKFLDKFWINKDYTPDESNAAFRAREQRRQFYQKKEEDAKKRTVDEEA